MPARGLSGGEGCDPNYPAQLGYELAQERQVAAVQEFLAFKTRYLGTVDSLDYFDWGPGAVGPSSFDSALLDWNAALRPAYCGLTGEVTGNCTGSLRSVRVKTKPPVTPSTHCGTDCV